MKTRYLSKEELKISKDISSGKIKPIHIPRLKTSADILKYELCSEIIRYSKDNNIKQVSLALTLGINKSEISKMFSYRLSEFSSERLLGMVEGLIKSGAEIRLETIFEEVKKKVMPLDAKMRRKLKSETLSN